MKIIQLKFYLLSKNKTLLTETLYLFYRINYYETTKTLGQ